MGKHGYGGGGMKPPYSSMTNECSILPKRGVAKARTVVPKSAARSAAHMVGPKPAPTENMTIRPVPSGKGGSRVSGNV